VSRDPRLAALVLSNLTSTYSSNMAEEHDELERARRGDREAFGRLVRRHQRRVYAAALHILGSHNDADDVAQETFVLRLSAASSPPGQSVAK
jgi:RNA polymerase sigma-70 factor, ECF subfamily